MKRLSDPIIELIEELRLGRMILLLDDENRENEGDLVLAADFVNAEKLNFMMKEARGLICLALSPEQIQKLQIPLMIEAFPASHPFRKTDLKRPAFTVSIDATHGLGSGTSASDRALTIWLASRPNTKPEDLQSPGHVFPLRACPGGVFERRGHTEGSVELVKMAGLNPASVICEVVKENGEMARREELFKFAATHNLKIGTVADLCEYIQTQKTALGLQFNQEVFL